MRNENWCVSNKREIKYAIRFRNVIDFIEINVILSEIKKKKNDVKITRLGVDF